MWTASKQNETMKKKPGVYTAKNGARYRILPNGKARFIKRTASASEGAPKKKRRRTRKRTGGAVRTGGSAMTGGGMGHYLHY